MTKLFRLNELRVVAFAQFATKSAKTIVTVDIEYQKLVSHSVTTRLSLHLSLPRMLQMYSHVRI